MENLIEQPPKPPVFGKKLLFTFLYNYISVMFIIVIPMYLSWFTVLLIKTDLFKIITQYSNENFENQIEIFFQQASTNVLDVYFSILIFIAFLLTSLVLYQDLLKHYLIDKNNFKVALKLLAIPFLILLLIDRSLLSLISIIIAFIFLYWLLNKKYIGNTTLFEKKFLNIKNEVIVFLLVFALTFILSYLIY